MIGINHRSQSERIRILDESSDSAPVAGTVDISVPCDIFWEHFRQAHRWSKWNACFFWVANRELVQGRQLIWAFQPIKRCYLYRMPAWARIVELVPGQRVTWEVTAVPGMYARHTYSAEDLGFGRTRFGSWEKAMGPGFRLMERFWTAHFMFVNHESLTGAQRLETIYKNHGSLGDPAWYREA
ncbi:hypothetical protein NKI79_26860 [Mesorhizobium sp. M0340]|uniref:hypothetical protein n=1 Tax=Mesorhizobium sp. M0340 TaxID=2956939 RepID=UPI003339813C